jgi:hypothetical protein
MLGSVGPGVGILLSYCGHDPFYWDATMKTMIVQLYSVIAINIAEITTARMSDSWIYRAFMLTFVLQLEIIQGALFLQVEVRGRASEASAKPWEGAKGAKRAPSVGRERRERRAVGGSEGAPRGRAGATGAQRWCSGDEGICREARTNHH